MQSPQTYPSRREAGKMDCTFCGKAFNKGEHLRRHERSHTGHRPFSCKVCKRAFSRQDSLMRHERVHERRAPGGIPSPSSDRLSLTASVSGSALNTIDLSVTDSDDNIPHGSQGLPTSQSNASQWQFVPAMGGQAATPLSELDFSLIWPDSEDLFQSILAADSASSWQLPLTSLPLPSPDARSLCTASFFGDREPSVRDVPSGGNQKAVFDVSRMVSSYSSSITAAVDAKAITSVFLDECLHMFFVRFVPTFPVLHRETFVFRDCAHPLLLNAIAIGSLYLGPKDAVIKGEVLWRLAHTAVATSWQSLIAHSGPQDACRGVQLVLTALLSVVYGSLSQNAAIRTASQALHPSAFFWARQCGMYECEPYDASQLPSIEDDQTSKEQQWHIWIAREIQQRALLAHHILDGLLAQMSGNSTVVRHASNSLHLLGNDAAFQATSADEWLSHMLVEPTQHSSFRTVIRQLFSPSQEPYGMNIAKDTFTIRVLLEGIQSIIADCDANEDVAVGEPSRFEIRQALLHLYELIIQSAGTSSIESQELLLRWHAVCIESIIKSAHLCQYLCARWEVDQELWPSNKMRIREYDLTQWTESSEGRKALLHAVAIQDIVEQLPRGRAHTIHMPSSLFAASTIYSVFSFAGHKSVRLPNAVDWKDVLGPSDANSEAIPTNSLSVTMQYLQGNGNMISRASMTARNLLYEFNSIQKLFGCLKTQWGISAPMEKVVNQWITFCHTQ